MMIVIRVFNPKITCVYTELPITYGSVLHQLDSIRNLFQRYWTNSSEFCMNRYWLWSNSLYTSLFTLYRWSAIVITHTALNSSVSSTAEINSNTHFVCVVCFTLYCEKSDAILNNRLEKHGCVHEFEDLDEGIADEETEFNCLTTGCKLVEI